MSQESSGHTDPANDRQVGGEHYKDSAIKVEMKCGNCGHTETVHLQHWDVAWRLKWNVFQVYVTKYLWRVKDSTLEDAKKARHTLDKYIEELEQG